MPDVYYLPNNDENYQKIAQRHLEQGNYQEALLAFEKSYHLKPSLEVFAELVKFYAGLEQVDSLAAIWQEADYSKEEIYELEILTYLYQLSLPLLLTPDLALLELYQLRDHIQRMGWQDKVSNDLIDRLSQEMNFKQQLENLSTEEYPDFIMAYHQENPRQLIQSLRNIHKLKLNQVADFLEAVIACKDIDNITRNEGLNQLIEMDYDKEMPYYWFHQLRSVNPSHLQPLYQDPAYQGMLSLIENYTDKENPNLAFEIRQQFTLQAMVYFPYLNDVIQEPQEWLAYFSQQLGLSDEETGPSDSKLVAYYQEAQAQLNKLLSPS